MTKIICLRPVKGDLTSKRRLSSRNWRRRQFGGSRDHLQSRGASSRIGRRQTWSPTAHLAGWTDLDEAGDQFLGNPNDVVSWLWIRQCIFTYIYIYVCMYVTGLDLPTMNRSAGPEQTSCLGHHAGIADGPWWGFWTTFPELQPAFPRDRSSFYALCRNETLHQHWLMSVGTSETYIRSHSLELEHLFNPKPVLFLASARNWLNQWDSYRNWADSTAVSLGSINTVLMLRALLAYINALSCFLMDRSST